MSESVKVSIQHGVMVLELNRPERKNALSVELLRRLRRELERLDASCTGVVITGTSTAFSSGADFTEITGTRTDLEYDVQVEKVIQIIADCSVPVIAALEGPCMGAAAHLALACDIRIGSDNAFVQIPAIQLGLLYSPESISWLSKHYRRDVLRRLLLLAERFDAMQCLAAGLFSELVPAGTAAQHAVDKFRSLIPAQVPAIAATRQLLTDLENSRYDAEYWQQKRIELLDSPARAQAVARAQQRHLTRN